MHFLIYFHFLILINFLKSFDGLNKTTFLAEIIFSSFVLGFLPSLCFLYLISKVPKFEILTFLFFFKFLIIILSKSSKIISKIFLINQVAYK